MKTEIRSLGILLIAPLVLLFPATTLPAASADKNLIDEQAITQLEQRAQQANPRDQCMLYTELVSAMTNLAGKQMLDGDSDHASEMLKRIEHYALLIHQNLTTDPKHIKNAQMMMHQTTYRLNEYLHEASSEDQATLKATLKQLNQVQDELLTQVFKH
jgi:hypothetical protein